MEINGETWFALSTQTRLFRNVAGVNCVEFLSLRLAFDFLSSYFTVQVKGKCKLPLLSYVACHEQIGGMTPLIPYLYDISRRVFDFTPRPLYSLNIGLDGFPSHSRCGELTHL
jgi:hypothetical protein